MNRLILSWCWVTCRLDSQPNGFFANFHGGGNNEQKNNEVPHVQTTSLDLPNHFVPLTVSFPASFGAPKSPLKKKHRDWRLTPWDASQPQHLADITGTAVTDHVSFCRRTFLLLAGWFILKKCIKCMMHVSKVRKQRNLCWLICSSLNHYLNSQSMILSSYKICISCIVIYHLYYSYHTYNATWTACVTILTWLIPRSSVSRNFCRWKSVREDLP